MKDKSAIVGATVVGMPFVTFYEKERRLSDDAVFNDCAARCDTNQDGVITLAEAEIFARLKD
jgi:hypothetical protein